MNQWTKKPTLPELPEVETIARQLARSIQGRRIRRLQILDSRLAPRQAGRARGRTVRRVLRLGKRIVMEMAGASGKPPLWLAVHLGMTGRLIWIQNQPSLKKKHLRARLVLEGGDLCFYDVRRWGKLGIYTSLDEVTPAGLDPVCGAFTRGKLSTLLAGSRQEIKVWLMRQDRLTGIGNIYASEILHSDRIHPVRLAGVLDATEAGRLHSATRRVLDNAIKKCGTTFSDFQDTAGRIGSYQKYLKVYGRAGKPCRRCRAPIERIVQQGRSTFFCPKCQRC